VKKLTISLIKMYQKTISSNSYIQCRHFPTCSNYSVAALEKFGFLIGIFISVRRLLRCFFFNKMSYDPLPEIYQIKLLNFLNVPRETLRKSK